VTARWTTSSLYASVRRSSSTVRFVIFCATASADNLTVRMSIISLLFVLMFLLLLALENSNLPWVIVLVLNHTSTIHAAVLFLIVEINLRVLNCYYFQQLQPLLFSSSGWGQRLLLILSTLVNS